MPTHFYHQNTSCMWKVSHHGRIRLCRTMVVLLTKTVVQTYMYCVPFASTWDRFGMTAMNECSMWCPSDCLMKRDQKLPSCTAIFWLGIVILQCVHVSEVVCGLYDTHLCIICPVCDVTHMRKSTKAPGLSCLTILQAMASWVRAWEWG